MDRIDRIKAESMKAQMLYCFFFILFILSILLNSLSHNLNLYPNRQARLVADGAAVITFHAY